MTASTKPPRHRRRRYLVDAGLQVAIALQLLGVLAGIGLLYTVGLFVLPDESALGALAPAELRRVLLKANAIYFALGGAIICVLAILLTHRPAGPALVLRRAVEAMRRGDFDERLSLRRRDYFKPLAAALAELRADLLARDEERARALADLSRCLEEGDIEAARELVARLRSLDARPLAEARREGGDAQHPVLLES